MNPDKYKYESPAEVTRLIKGATKELAKLERRNLKSNGDTANEDEYKDEKRRLTHHIKELQEYLDPEHIQRRDALAKIGRRIRKLEDTLNDSRLYRAIAETKAAHGTSGGIGTWDTHKAITNFTVWATATDRTDLLKKYTELQQLGLKAKALVSKGIGDYRQRTVKRWSKHVPKVDTDKSERSVMANSAKMNIANTPTTATSSKDGDSEGTESDDDEEEVKVLDASTSLAHQLLTDAQRLAKHTMRRRRIPRRGDESHSSIALASPSPLALPSPSGSASASASPSPSPITPLATTPLALATAHQIGQSMIIERRKTHRARITEVITLPPSPPNYFPKPSRFSLTPKELEKKITNVLNHKQSQQSQSAKLPPSQSKQHTTKHGRDYNRDRDRDQSPPSKRRRVDNG